MATYPAPTEIIEIPLGGDALAEEIDALDHDETLRELIHRQVQESLDWKSEHLDPDMEEATDYYKGRPYGDEREGRSQVVTREVKNAAAQSMPSLMRVFTSSEYVAEFKPRGPEDVETAKLQTQTVQYVFFEDNDGFLTLHSAFKDALVRRIGFTKWYAEDRNKVLGSEHTGLNQAELDILEQDPEVDSIEVLDTRTETVPGPEGPVETEVFDIRCVRIETDVKIVVEAVPPEEMVWSPYAKDFYNCPMVGQVRDVPASELREMGVPEEILEERLGRSSDLEDNELARARRVDENEDALFETEADPSMRPVRFGELYVRYDADDDGIAELHKVLTVGDDYFVWEDELADEIPFALFEVDPEPHTIVGMSQADNIMDLQRIISHVTRGMLDSLTSHLNPAMEVVETEVNMKDAQNQELGRIIRVRRPGMMREVVTPFVGGAALPVLENLRNQVSERVGVSAVTEGLEPDALQSTTAAAVQATVDAGKQRLEMMARMLAETGMKRMFRGILRLLVKHQDKPMLIRLNGEFTAVDPRHWDADKDVVVNVALGSGLIDQKIGHLMQIAAKQEQHLQQGSPLVDFATIRATYARITELMGFRNPDAFFKPFGPQEQQQYAQQQAANQKPSDTEVLREIEMAKIQARSQEKAMEMQLKQAELKLKQLELMLQARTDNRELDLKTAIAQSDAALDRATAAVDAQMKQLQGLKLLSDTRVGE